MGAAPRKDVIRETSDPGDIIILLGAYGPRRESAALPFFKVHTTASIESAG